MDRHPPGSQSSIRVPIRRADNYKYTDDSDWLVIEEPLEIRLSQCINGSSDTHSISVTMRTPGADFDLAAGFLLTEGIIRNASDIQSMGYTTDQNTDTPSQNIVVVNLMPEVEFDIGKLQRNFYATSSCGVCGKASIEALSFESAYEVNGDKLLIEHTTLTELPDRLANQQATFSRTGGLHAAALFDATGQLLEVREDIGRHNAVDKLIGAMLRANKLPLWNQGILSSGRASFEILQKARMAGCPMVAAVGAPSSLAADLAWEFDMTLIGFLRDQRFNIYTGPARIGPAETT
ncbi:MAG: formate dehydrogenase accessory sulfurtransferase FdhD [Gammaproteobacteria bacterium]|jgi:FdhD protein|nr:sulfurtransferase FdhD [Chromatiales bacterium]MDP6414738.1 formate dehydrogenase accessory sulfurtransferase FdhD [Gammaproteobacteria bacterium]MDP6673555.1 formate dehydrogenase accessory sulfurtransferase FdhD [Gammaproteobacteria bacterium]